MMTADAHDLIEVATRGEAVHVDTQGERLLSVTSAYALASRLIDAAQQAGDECPLNPLLDKVVVHVIDEANRKSGGGVFIPDTATQQAIRGVVLAIGPGRWEGGKHVQIEGVAIGDVVTMSKHAGYEIKVGDMSYLSIRAADILGTIPVKKKAADGPTD